MQKFKNLCGPIESIDFFILSFCRNGSFLQMDTNLAGSVFFCRSYGFNDCFLFFSGKKIFYS